MIWKEIKSNGLFGTVLRKLTRNIHRSMNVSVRIRSVAYENESKIRVAQENYKFMIPSYRRNPNTDIVSLVWKHHGDIRKASSSLLHQLSKWLSFPRSSHSSRLPVEPQPLQTHSTQQDEKWEKRWKGLFPSHVSSLWALFPEVSRNTSTCISLARSQLYGNT